MSPLPESNDASIRNHDTFEKFFEATPVPDSLEGFEVDNREELSEVWPEGTEKATEVSLLLQRELISDPEPIPIYQDPKRAIQIRLSPNRRCCRRQERF